MDAWQQTRGKPPGRERGGSTHVSDPKNTRPEGLGAPRGSLAFSLSFPSFGLVYAGDSTDPRETTMSPSRDVIPAAPSPRAGCWGPGRPQLPRDVLPRLLSP